MTATCQPHRARPGHRIWILLSKSNRTRCSDVREAWLQLLWGRILTVKGHLAVHPPAACSAATCYSYVTHKLICLRIIVSAAKYTSSVFTVQSYVYICCCDSPSPAALGSGSNCCRQRRSRTALGRFGNFPCRRTKRSAHNNHSAEPAGGHETYRDTSSQVLFRRWIALHCRAERMARNEEKFFSIRHSWKQQPFGQKQTKTSVPCAHELSKPEVSPGQLLSTSPADGLSGWASVPGCSGRWWWHSWWQSWIGPRWLWWWEPGAPYLSYPAETKSPPGSGREPPSWTDPEWTERKTGVKINIYF